LPEAPDLDVGRLQGGVCGTEQPTSRGLERHTQATSRPRPSADCKTDFHPSLHAFA
jgi:hypothetical protein